MEFERPPTLRPAAPPDGEAAQPLAPAGGHVNPVAELVADLLAATVLLSDDKLAVVRGRAGQGSIAQAILDEGLASTDGVARIRAARHQLPLVDLPLAGVDAEAAKLVPLHVLERIVAIPYGIESGYLRVALADPANINGIDELRLATRYPLELAVAPRDDIVAEIRRLVRAWEATGARAILEEEAAAAEESLEEAADDLEADDGFSDVPL